MAGPEAIEKQGIAASDIATTGYSMRPDVRPCERPSKERASGFVARNGIRVTVRAPDRVGTTIDAALAGGANRVDDIAFRLADDRAAVTPISAGELTVAEQVSARWRFIADAP